MVKYSIHMCQGGSRYSSRIIQFYNNDIKRGLSNLGWRRGGLAHRWCASVRFEPWLATLCCVLVQDPLISRPCKKKKVNYSDYSFLSFIYFLPTQQDCVFPVKRSITLKNAWLPLHFMLRKGSGKPIQHVISVYL